ncbi:MAG TPA: kelch repeat-containing protein [Planctomycetota bacterium]|nr:kelch repeat-containing protein [Planctomycetota bacterium]
MLFGGFSNANRLDDTWEFDGARWNRIMTTTSPPARTGHALAYDSARRRIVLFGGEQSIISNFADTWEFDGTNWAQMQVATSPPARLGHALAYDQARARTVLFGGNGSPARLADTWEYDGTNWTPIATTTSPPAREYHALAHDPVRGRTVLFGGFDIPCSSCAPLWLADTWEYDGTDWTQIVAPTSPSARCSHAMTYDLASGATLLFGGADALFPLSDTWRVDGIHWTRITTAAWPSPRAGHALACDLGRGRTILFGGANSNGAFADAWEFDGSNWNRITLSPPPRQSHAIAHDPVRARTVLFGGLKLLQANTYTVAPVDDTWEYDGASWMQRITANSPTARFGHAFAHDSGRSRTVLFGGSANFFTNLGDTWEYDGTNWRQITTTVSPPARIYSALAHDVARGRLVLFGGMGNFSRLGDTWEYDGTQWTQSATTTSPQARSSHALAFDAARARTVLFGGLDFQSGNQVVFGDTWEYDGTIWTMVATATSPAARSSHALACDPLRGRLVLFGGADINGQMFADTWEYDGTDWQQLVTVIAPSPRLLTVLAFDLARGSMVLFGGAIVHGALDDTHELLPPPNATWTRYGIGCVGSAGTPVLAAAPGTQPALGSPFALQVLRLPPQPGAALLAFGTELVRWNGNPLPAALDPFGLPGCKLWIGPAAGASLLLAHAGNTVSFACPIPLNPALAGVVVGAQALVLDANAPSGLGAVTNGVILRLH